MAVALGLAATGGSGHLAPSAVGGDGGWSLLRERLDESVDAARDAASRYPRSR